MKLATINPCIVATTDGVLSHPPRTGNVIRSPHIEAVKRLYLVAYVWYVVEFAAMQALVYVRYVTALGTYNGIFNYDNGRARVEHVRDRARVFRRGINSPLK